VARQRGKPAVVVTNQSPNPVNLPADPRDLISDPTKRYSDPQLWHYFNTVSKPELFVRPNNAKPVNRDTLHHSFTIPLDANVAWNRFVHKQPIYWLTQSGWAKLWDGVTNIRGIMHGYPK